MSWVCERLMALLGAANEARVVGALTNIREMRAQLATEMTRSPQSEVRMKSADRSVMNTALEVT